jgi:hypothetical protein
MKESQGSKDNVQAPELTDILFDLEHFLVFLQDHLEGGLFRKRRLLVPKFTPVKLN